MSIQPLALRVEGLSHHIRGRSLLSALSFEVQPGEIVGLLGPNGAGKTTTFSLLAGLEPLQAGEIWLGDTSLCGLPYYQRVRCGLRYLTQTSALFAELTVRENVQLAAELLEPERAERPVLDRWLERFGLLAAADRPAGVLSGGEKRRLELARVLLGAPRVLMLDEPFAALDPLGVQALEQVLRQLREARLPVLLTDHRAEVCQRLCDRLLLLVGGRLVLEGPPERLLSDPLAHQLYLGG
ncbi:MAG: ATP-binding cassette domain-containing protein [Myxococcota bacterium]